MTEIFDITNRALIHVTKTDIYKAQTILSVMGILLLIIIAIMLIIICSKFAKMITHFFRNLIF